MLLNTKWKLDLEQFHIYIAKPFGNIANNVPDVSQQRSTSCTQKYSLQALPSHWIYKRNRFTKKPQLCRKSISLSIAIVFSKSCNEACHESKIAEHSVGPGKTCPPLEIGIHTAAENCLVMPVSNTRSQLTAEYNDVFLELFIISYCYFL